MADKILVVGQHVTLRLTLCSWLEALLPPVYTINSGEETADKMLAHRTPPSLIVFDAGFPGLHSLNIIDRIKKLAPDIPLIVLTTYQLDSYQDQALEAGATACFPKDVIYDEHFAPTLSEFLSPVQQVN